MDILTDLNAGEIASHNLDPKTVIPITLEAWVLVMKTIAGLRTRIEVLERAQAIPYSSAERG